MPIESHPPARSECPCSSVGVSCSLCTRSNYPGHERADHVEFARYVTRQGAGHVCAGCVLRLVVAQDGRAVMVTVTVEPTLAVLR